MTEVETGYEPFSDEDRVYAGSRYRDVVDAVFANPYQHVWGRAGEPELPNDVATIRSVFGGLVSHLWDRRFEHASARAVDSGADLRWGRTGRGSGACCTPTASV